MGLFTVTLCQLALIAVLAMPAKAQPAPAPSRCMAIAENLDSEGLPVALAALT